MDCSSQDQGQGLGSILDHLKTVIDYDDAALFEVEGRELVVLLYRGRVARAEHLWWGYSLESWDGDARFPSPVVIADARADTPEARALRRMTFGQAESIFGHLRSYVAIPLVDRGEPVAILAAGHRDPGHYTQADGEAGVQLAQRAAASIRETMQYARAMVRTGEMETLLTIQQALAAHLDQDTVLHMIVSQAGRLTNSRTSIVFLLQGDYLCPVTAVHMGTRVPPDTVGSYRIPFDASLAGESIRIGRPLRSLDVCHDPRVYNPSGATGSAQSMLCVPLVSGGRSLGALIVLDKMLGTFGPCDERVLMMLSPAAAISLENARLVAQVEELSRQSERQRIGEELHASLAQTLFTIGLEAQQVQNAHGLDERAHRSIQTIRRLADRSSHDIRNAIITLRSKEFAGGDNLLALLQEMVDELQATGGIAASLIAPTHIATLPPVVGEAIYSVVREALTNVRKHAQATAVIVGLHGEAGWLTVTIQDDGVGIGATGGIETEAPDLHFGVANMRRLVERAHGEFRIANNDDRGVTVRARLPVGGNGS